MLCSKGPQIIWFVKSSLDGRQTGIFTQRVKARWETLINGRLSFVFVWNSSYMQGTCLQSNEITLDQPRGNVFCNRGKLPVGGFHVKENRHRRSISLAMPTGAPFMWVHHPPAVREICYMGSGPNCQKNVDPNLLISILCLNRFYYISQLVRALWLVNFAGCTLLYYMALSHKDWELPNSRIWLAEMDIDRGLDFPI